jgi:hypothetical protein
MQRNSGMYLNQQRSPFQKHPFPSESAIPRRKTVAELIHENEERIKHNTQENENLQKRMNKIKDNINKWKQKYSQYTKLNRKASNPSASPSNTISLFFNENKTELFNIGIYTVDDFQTYISPNKPTQLTYMNNLITSLNSITIPQYDITHLIDPSFLDVICTNCYEIVNYLSIDEHSMHCVIKNGNCDSFCSEITFDDVNCRLYKLYNSLQDKKEMIIQTKDVYLKVFYNKLSEILYNIVLNNNSIIELNDSVKQLHILIRNGLEHLDTQSKYAYEIFIRRTIQLIYVKSKSIQEIFGKKMTANVDDDNDDEEFEIDENEFNGNNNNGSFLEDDIEKEVILSIKDQQKRSSLKHNGIVLNEIVSDVEGNRESCGNVDVSISSSESCDINGNYIKNRLTYIAKRLSSEGNKNERFST